MHLLILEGNTPELVAGRTARGLLPAAESYGEALRACRPRVSYEVSRPYDGDGAPDLAGVDGLVLTGSGVDWAADDRRAAPFWRACELAFAAGVPVLGSCWGHQCGAVVLGGRVGAGPNGIEAPVARDVTLTEAGRRHPFHSGRPARFDVLCMHRDDVLEPPPGAVVTAKNVHSVVQAMVVEHGTTRFWGVQYHPEIDLRDVAAYLARTRGAFAAVDPSRDLEAACEAVAADPNGRRREAAALGFGGDILDAPRHRTEIANWLAAVAASGVPA